MSDKYVEYRKARLPLPPTNRLWPLYGAGFENLGKADRTIDVTFPFYGPDELLVRHDACGLCFSDIKVIDQGESHPRIFRSMKKEPVCLGHEVCMTVVGVGQELHAEYKVGDRFIIQADVFFKGIGYAYGYMMQGGLSQYAVIDHRVLHGDQGNYLIPIKTSTGYAESALAEPWACVVAAYMLQYRSTLKNGGIAWFVGAGGNENYTLSAGFDAKSHPARVLLTGVPEKFAKWIKQQASEFKIEVTEIADPAKCPIETVDDIVLLGANADLVEKLSPRLGMHGIMAIIADAPLPRPISVDVGRIHYNRWLFIGGKGPDIAAAYAHTPVRSALKAGGRAWFVGAGGPIGRMHVQKAIQLAKPPKMIVCTDASDVRLADLRETFMEEAKAKNIEFVCLNPTNKEAYAKALEGFKAPGFDDIVVLAPVAAAIVEAADYLGEKGVMNIFAGVARGTLANIDLSNAYGCRQARIIGHSASSIDDLRAVLKLVESHELSTNRSVAAVGSLSAAKEGLKSLKEARFPGKVVIFPFIKELPLTPVPALKEKLPTVYAKLRNGREWTLEAEEEFLRVMLP